ncbi:MAG: hypothetical protein PHV34_18970 [Verrucomicrobiae bacterium]|nr:hypothetical protein [Verrucomicrobiae bacterium]
MNSQDIKDYAKQRGADLVGIASIDRFASLPAEKNPSSIFPECQSVIVVGRRILRGALRGIEEGTNFGGTYGMFGYRWLEDNFLARTTYDLTCHIETKGFEAVPLFGYAEDGMPTGRPVAPGKPAPNIILDLDYAAHAAGLGEIGLGGFFLTPQYGSRQRFATILTDLKLEADPILKKTMCDDCQRCAKACPLNAIQPDKTTKNGVPGHQMDVASIDYAICRQCLNGAMQAPGRGNRPDRLGSACARTCLAHLEKTGKCVNRFSQPFRKRTPWAVDTFHRPVESAIQAAKI